MKHRPLITQDASSALVATQVPCPLCAEGLIRIRRRTIDRLLSLFVLVHRYRCADGLCGWEGNLRIRSRAVKTLRDQSEVNGLTS